MLNPDSSNHLTEYPATAEVGPPMIGALLRLPWDAVAHRILAALHEHGFDDIDAPHLGVILWPGPEGMRPSDLAARMRVTKQALNYLLGSLERLGYLERRPDPSDGRARRIALTERGRSIVPVVRNAVSEVEREWVEALGPERFVELREILLELAKVVAPELKRA